MNTPTRRRDAKSVAAEAAFHARVAELGGEVVGKYVNGRTPVDCRCAAGHDCRPRPSNAMRFGICLICVGHDPETAETVFRKEIADLGGQVVGEYVNSYTPVQCICSNGHECFPRPDSLRRRGICSICSRKKPATAEAAVRDRVAELGGEVVGPYVSNKTPIDVRCVNGHHCRPQPSSVLSGNGLCLTCVGHDRGVAEAAFRVRVASMGGQVVGAYVGAHTPVDCICMNGHACAPRPADIRKGKGLCVHCRGAAWDIFYVVSNSEMSRVKFGITTDDPRPRLCVHRRMGYADVVRVHRDLPTAPDLERHVLNTLRGAGIPAVQGREYYDLGALPVVLDVVDGWVAT